MSPYEELMLEQDKPVVGIDSRGQFIYINQAFEKTYGWNKDELLGKLVTEIMPPHMRDAHNIGFSRFLTTEKPTLLGKSLSLPVACKNGDIKSAEHFIVGEKVDGQWNFAARITLKSNE